MDSDDSRDDLSSDSDSGSVPKGPHSPSSGDSQDSKPSSSPRGPKSPVQSGPRSPSPDISIQSNSQPNSPGVKSISSHDDSTRHSTKSPADDEDDEQRSTKSISSQNSANSLKSVSMKSPSSINSNESLKSNDSIKCSSRHSPDNTQRRPVKAGERRGPVSPPPDEGNTSDSSLSSRRSSRNKSVDKLEAEAEEISDGDMEYEVGRDSEDELDKIRIKDKMKISLSHEDLSDVSDLDSLGGPSDDEFRPSTVEQPPAVKVDLRQKIDEAKHRKLNEKQNPPEKTSKTEDGEEQLDFEAEDGECVDENGKVRPSGGEGSLQAADDEEGIVPETSSIEKAEVEEGEVTDDDEIRPEETEPRPVCRFYSRGQCTWGASCRFLHPGVTDKGNYTMFELIRPMVPGGPGYGLPEERFERPSFGVPAVRGEPHLIESAWERGLRTAKEMMRKAIKRKEQDMDFEEKKMNLTLAQDELDKENGYYTRSASPIPVDPIPRHFVSVRHPIEYRQQPPRMPDEYYGRRIVYEPEPRAVRIEPEFEVPRERVRTYRELPPHRMPDYYNDKYEEPAARRPKREVIVQRVEPAGGRGDEWADPWMRSKSPSGRGKTARFGTRRQSYSSASSYSSSSSSRSSTASSKSSYRAESRSRSRSPTARVRRRVAAPKSPSHRLHRIATASSSGGPHRPVSPSVIVSEKKAANERALLMNPPAPSPKKAHKDTRPPSPGMMRTSAQNPPAPTSKGLTDQYGRTRDRNKHDSERKKLAVAAAIAAASVKSRARVSGSTSGSDTSGSSSSDSESSYSSSSTSRDGSPTPRRKVSEKVELAAMALKAKALDALKGDKSQIKLSLKTQVSKKPGLSELTELNRKAAKLEQGKKRLASSPPASDMTAVPKMAAIGKLAANNKKSTSRREELLKQLKAVEDAIAKKRSKIN